MVVIVDGGAMRVKVIDVLACGPLSVQARQYTEGDAEKTYFTYHWIDLRWLGKVTNEPAQRAQE